MLELSLNYRMEDGITLGIEGIYTLIRSLEVINEFLGDKAIHHWYLERDQRSHNALILNNIIPVANILLPERIQDETVPINSWDRQKFYLASPGMMTIMAYF